jgi:hypothetical protein
MLATAKTHVKMQKKNKNAKKIRGTNIEVRIKSSQVENKRNNLGINVIL